MTLLALTAKRAIEQPPTKRKGKRDPNPKWVRYSAAALVQMLIEQRPDEPFAPNAANNYTTGIMSDAIQWLVGLGLCGWIGQRTLYDWYREALAADALAAPGSDMQSNSRTTA
jgi:hypothetical protein